jgi:hypothetical protein
MEPLVEAIGVAGELLHFFPVAVGAQVEEAGIGEVDLDLFMTEAANPL